MTQKTWNRLSFLEQMSNVDEKEVKGAKEVIGMINGNIRFSCLINIVQVIESPLALEPEA